MPARIRVLLGAAALAILAFAGVWFLSGPGLSNPSGPAGDREVKP